MSASVEASELIQALARPWQVGDSVKAAIRRAARKAQLEAGLAKRLWYGEARRVDAEVMDKLRAAHAADAQLLQRSRDGYSELQERIAALEEALAVHLSKQARPVADEFDSNGRS